MYCIGMTISLMRPARFGVALACVLCCSLFTSSYAWSQGDKPPAAGDKAAAEKPALPPLPADAHAPQQMQLDGKTLKYTVTVGGLPVRDKDGKVAGQVVTTAYTV